MKFIELFCGIGGFRYGLEKAGGYECAYANDIDKYASAIYRYHWNDGTMHEGDIRTTDASSIPEHDLICAGFPCQSFSIAGKRGGFADTRGTLFFEICRIARAKGTKFLWLENVQGLLSHDEGNTFQTIIGALDDLGYDCQWQVLNSKNHGVPQNRERVFIIGNLRGQRRPKVFPLGETSEASNGYGQGNYTGTVKAGWGNKQNDATYVQAIDANYDKGNCGFAGTKRATVMVHTAFQGETREYDDCSPTISMPSGGGYLPMIANAIDPDGYLRDGKRPRDEDGRPQLLPIGYRRIRRLTPIECERLQGFPDNWTKYGIDGKSKQVNISDHQRYKCCGNAVTTNVITDIAQSLIGSAYVATKQV